MCNCSSIPANICTQCSLGNTCGCPPDYTVMPQPVICGCCPSGYTYSAPSNTYPDGICTSPLGATTNPIECNTCTESVSSDCVYLPAIQCLGLPAGTTVTQLAEFLCSEAFATVIMTAISSSSTIREMLCGIVSECPSGGSTVPVIGPIVVTVP